MKLNITPQEIINLFESPQLALDLDDDKWQDILRVLRFNDMTATLANILSVNNIALRSHFALKHLDSSSIYAQRQAQQVRNESYSLKKLLSNAEVNPIFLKGAAYILASDENSHGRLMSDIDILVDKKCLHEVESILKSNGWREKRLDNYDEQYYRKWSHELPPFRHITSGTTLDIHHTLIPPITGKSIPIESVLAESARVDGVRQTLSLEWRLLHCIIHFFFNEDYEKPFRDLWDLKCLFCSLNDKEHLESDLRDQISENGQLRNMIEGLEQDLEHMTAEKNKFETRSIEYAKIIESLEDKLRKEQERNKQLMGFNKKLRNHNYEH